MKKVTIQDVAKELNLSRNTVAKALNNSETVAYETRYVVIQKAYEMGYSKLLPVVLNEFNIKEHSAEVKTVVAFARRELSTFWNRIIMGISDELNKSSCKLQLNFISPEEEKELSIPIEETSNVDGIILLNVFTNEFVEKLASYNIPIVFLDSPEDSGEVISIGDIILFEGANSVKEMTEHMIAEGAKRLAFIGDITYCKSIDDRYQGFMAAIEHHNLPMDPAFLKIEHVPNRYYDYEEVKRAIDSFPYMPDAIVCANDDVAQDVMTYLEEKGLHIPEDVMITGFDNKEESSYITPKITTAYITNQRMGRRLVQQLMWRIDNKEMPHEIVTLSTEVIYRESSVKHK